MLISGASFFTDAYDLFVIGIIIIMLKPIFSLSTFQLGMLASSALFGAVIGPLIFGTVGDKIGRKYAYWITMLILIIGALGSATSANFISLFLWRFFLGIGIGGDYPLSSTIVAEYANRNDRGKLGIRDYSRNRDCIAASFCKYSNFNNMEIVACIRGYSCPFDYICKDKAFRNPCI